MHLPFSQVLECTPLLSSNVNQCLEAERKSPLELLGRNGHLWQRSTIDVLSHDVSDSGSPIDPGTYSLASPSAGLD